MGSDTDSEGTAQDRERRREIARDALDIGMDDPYWLHNLAQCLWHQDDAYSDTVNIVRRLREDAEVLETAHQKIESGELLPAEAALYVAERANFGDYDTRGHIYDNIPIEGRGGQ